MANFYNQKRDYNISLNQLMSMSEKELQEYESKLDTKLNHRLDRLEKASRKQDNKYTNFSDTYQKLLKDVENPQRDWVNMKDGRIRITSQRGVDRKTRLERIKAKVLAYGDTEAKDLKLSEWVKTEKELKSVGLSLNQYTKNLGGTMLTRNVNFARAFEIIGWENVEKYANRWLESVGNYASGLEQELLQSNGGGTGKYAEYEQWSEEQCLEWIMSTGRFNDSDITERIREFYGD